MQGILNEDFLDFIRALNTNDVEYLVVGGYAVILHGYPREVGWLVQDIEESVCILVA